MYGYLRFEIRTMHLFLHKNMTMLKLQLYLSSFLHLVQTISLQHSHIFVQKEVHRTYLEAQISVHISFKVRGQVFMEIHICGFSSLTSSDVPWLITFSLLKILKLLALLKILKSVFKIFVSVFVLTKTFKSFVRKNLVRKRIFVFVRGTTIRYEDLRKRNRFSFSFSYYHKGRPQMSSFFHSHSTQQQHQNFLKQI